MKDIHKELLVTMENVHKSVLKNKNRLNKMGHIIVVNDKATVKSSFDSKHKKEVFETNLKMMMKETLKNLIILQKRIETLRKDLLNNDEEEKDKVGYDVKRFQENRRNLFHRLNLNEVCINSPNMNQSKLINKMSSRTHSFEEFYLVSILPETLIDYHKISFASQTLLRYYSSVDLLDTYSSSFL